MGFFTIQHNQVILPIVLLSLKMNRNSDNEIMSSTSHKQQVCKPRRNTLVFCDSLIVFTYLSIIISHSVLIATAADYQGPLLGKLNSYAHQVNGDVYVIDEYSLLIKNFFYDGLSQDAFFWAGSSIRPSNKGFIIPSEDGRTNRLQRYTNRDITIRLPDDRKITSIRWLSIWDIRGSKNLGDIVIPEGFEPPTPKKISEFSQLAHGVRSETVTLLNSKAIGIQQLYFDGESKNAFFYAGIGPQPNGLGHKVPDETGSLEPLGLYEGENIVLELPGNLAREQESPTACSEI